MRAKEHLAISHQVFFILTCLVASFVAVNEGRCDNPVHGMDPFEPSVTKEESKLLNRAMSVVETNSIEALRMLKDYRSPNTSPALDFAAGNLHFQQEQLDEAASAYELALEKLPRFRSAMMNLGRVYLLQERTDDAIKLYQQLVADGQADADILLLLGHAMLMENLPVSAESAYRQSLLLDPRNSEAMLGLAKSLIQQERYPEGLSLVGEILTQEPTNKELWALQANAYLSMNKYGEAAQAIEKAKRLGCADSDMLATLGDLLLNQDQPGDALEAYKGAFTAQNLSVPRMLRAVEGFLMAGDSDGAKAMITRAEELKRSSSGQFHTGEQMRLLRLKAELARYEGRSHEAMELCSKVLRLDPLDARTMLVLAELQVEADHLEDAVMTCERAARVEGYEVDALVRQAQIEVQRERYRRAVTLLEAAQAFRNQAHVARYLEQVRRMAE